MGCGMEWDGNQFSSQDGMRCCDGDGDGDGVADGDGSWGWVMACSAVIYTCKIAVFIEPHTMYDTCMILVSKAKFRDAEKRE